ncbi:DUF7507 domain-containing protein, partial [Gracilibacillus alcaliphilus]|uniref:DUF7507 domain-containing protein n=1 Tax=Gracilibacillus alcaliphilus TaxID=1401441 RepID=UPI00195BA6FE
MRIKKSTASQVFNMFAITLLLFSTLLSAFPQNVVYAEGDDRYEDSENEDGNGSTRNEKEGREYDRANVDKRVTWSGENPGEYFIDLTIKGKTVASDETTDIVLVYDNSNSMATNNRVTTAREATIDFVNRLLTPDNENFQIALVTYGSAVFDGRYRSWMSQPGNTDNLSHKTLTLNAANITGQIPSNIPTDRGNTYHGGTFTEQALEEAGNILAGSNADNKIIITITDGAPTISYNPSGDVIGNGTSFTFSGGNHGTGAISMANQLKNNYELYTIAVELGDGDSNANASRSDIEGVINGISSSSDHTYYADEVAQMAAYLQEIASTLDQQSVVDGSVVDPMGEMFNLKGVDNFTAASDASLSDGNYYLGASDPKLLEGVSISTDGQTINMNGLNLGADEEVTLRYKVQIDTDNENFQVDELYRTNGETTLTPRSSHPDEKNTFPEPSASATGTSVSGEKTWQDNNSVNLRPDDIEIKLMRDINGNPVEVDNATVTPAADGAWTYEFPNQIKFDSQGNIIDYYVEEVEVPGYETQYGDNKLDITNILISNPEISLDKEANRDDLVVDEQIGYTFTVENTGNVPLSNVHLTDELENISDISYLTINGEEIENPESITLEPGDVLVAEATYTITQADVDKGQVVNHATVTGTSPSDEEVTDEDEAKVPQELNPGIELIKISDKESVSEVGDVITYSFEVRNTGNVTLNDILLDDPMLGGAIDLETTTLAPGEITKVAAEYTVTQEDINSGAIENVATVEGTPPGYDPEDPDSPEKPRDEDEEIVSTERDPAISLVKEADRDDLLEGEDINYTFTATNTGNVTLKNVTIEDVLEGISDIRYVSINGESIDNPESITLEPGDVLVAEASYRITQEDVDTGQVVNHATVTGDDPNDEPVTDDDRALVPHDPNADISLEKTSDLVEVTEAGQVIEYTFIVRNTGDVTLTDIVVDDPMIEADIELESTTLAPGETTKGTATYEVTEADLENGNITNVATVTGNPPNPEDEPPTEEDENIVPVGSIDLLKTSNVDAITEVGQEVTYTFEVTNTGEVTLNDVQVNDPMLGGEITLDKTTLEPGETTEGTAVYVVTEEDIVNEGITNTATATGNTPEDTPVEDEDTDNLGKASINLVKTSNVEEITEVGQEVTYTFEVTNTGDVTLENVQVNDPMLGGEITLSETTLEPGENTTGTAVYTVTQADLNNGGITNTATTTGETPEGITVDDEDDDEIPAVQTPDISLVKEADPEELVVGQGITYTFTVTNTGNVTLNNVQITDPLEGLSDIRYLSINGESIAALNLSKALITSLTMETQSLIVLEPGDVLVAEATYTVTQADVDRGVLENTATVEGTSSHDEKVTDEDDVVIEHDPNPAISLEKTSDVEEVTEAGQVVTYTFEVINTGDVTLTDIVVDDPRIDGAIELETTTLAPG